MNVAIIVNPATKINPNPPSLSDNKHHKKDSENDEDLLMEPEYIYRKGIKPDAAVSNKKNVLSLDNAVSDALLRSLNSIEDIEKEISSSLHSFPQDSEISPRVNDIKKQIELESTSKDSKYMAMLSEYNIGPMLLTEVSSEAYTFQSVAALDANSDWNSIKTRLLLASCSQCIPKSIDDPLGIYGWMQKSICCFFPSPLFMIKLATNGAILRLPAIKKQTLLDLQKVVIQNSILPLISLDICCLSNKLAGQKPGNEFTYPIEVFLGSTYSKNGSFSPMINNVEFLAKYTIFLQAHIHIVRCLLGSTVKRKATKFSNLILNEPTSLWETSKTELAHFLKILAGKLTPGSYIPLQEIILSYEALLL